MKCSDIINRLEQLAPASLACSWDNTGLLLGRKDKDVKRILVTLDVTDSVVAEAIEWKADMMISHHPLIFSAMKKITTDTMNGRKVWKLAGADMACYAMHTSFDLAPKGMAWLGASKLGLEELEVLDDKVKYLDEEGKEQEAGIGMIGTFSEPVTCSELIQKVKKAFGISLLSVYETATYNTSSDAFIQKVAICPGSGKDYIFSAMKAGVQVYITGDLGHHAGLDAREMGLTVIDASHYHMEKMFVPYVAEYLKSHLGEQIALREVLDPCPFQVY